MAPLYKPPTKVTTVQKPWLALVNQSDPEFERKKHREVEYVTSQGRVFVGDPYQRGIANRRSNSYAVGQPFGGLDAAITAALAPTVGNAVPGLYQGVDDLKGWA